ncbi:unnamed protein product, partial [Amoebophrya sp. A120]
PTANACARPLSVWTTRRAFPLAIRAGTLARFFCPLPAFRLVLFYTNFKPGSLPGA